MTRPVRHAALGHHVSRPSPLLYILLMVLVLTASGVMKYTLIVIGIRTTSKKDSKASLLFILHYNYYKIEAVT